MFKLHIHKYKSIGLYYKISYRHIQLYENYECDICGKTKDVLIAEQYEGDLSYNIKNSSIPTEIDFKRQRYAERQKSKT